MLIRNFSYSIYFILLYLIVGCGASSEKSTLHFEGGNPGIATTTGEFESSVPPPPPPPIIKQDIQNSEPVSEIIEKKIIKTADITIEVKNIKKSRAALGKMLQIHKAYISSEKEENISYQISNTITIRIISERFDSLLNQIGNEAYKIDSKNISISDVTEEFIDITARLKNKKEVEKQYLELLKKARTVAEIINVNEHLRMLREEIESQEGRLKYLNSQVSYSTITLYMYEKSEKVYRGFGHKIVEGLEGGWKGILAFLLALTYGWPVILIIILILWFIKYRRKKKQGN